MSGELPLTARWIDLNSEEKGERQKVKGESFWKDQDFYNERLLEHEAHQLCRPY